MSLEKKSFVDRIEVLSNGVVQIRTCHAVMEDGVQISGTFERSIVAPGDDYSGHADNVQAICAATHTTEVIDAYKAATAAQGV